MLLAHYEKSVNPDTLYSDYIYLFLRETEVIPGVFLRSTIS